MGSKRILLVSVAFFVLVAAHGIEASQSHPFGGLIESQLDSDANIMDRICVLWYLPNTGWVLWVHWNNGRVWLAPRGQGSAAAVWILDEGDRALSSLRSIMIGWDVLPEAYGDSKTHFCTKWTNDGFQSTGCINMNCPGFQPEKGAAIVPGDTIDHVSSPKGAKRNLNLKIIKNGTSGDWLVHCGLDRDPELIGRFPRSLLTGGFADKAVTINFGGVVTRPAPMGSGYLPTPDPGSAASISNILLVDSSGRASPVPEVLRKVETNQGAYAVSPFVGGKFFYGGRAQHNA
ncbi:hypothetical protein ACP4OV_016058 [Aristida adscensionis]